VERRRYGLYLEQVPDEARGVGDARAWLDHLQEEAVDDARRRARAGRVSRRWTWCSACDIAATKAASIAVSRRGLLPQVHAFPKPGAVPPPPAWNRPDSPPLRQIVSEVRDQVSRARGRRGLPRRRRLAAPENAAAVALAAARDRSRTAYDGEEGLGVAAEFRPQVTLLDIGLPKLDGYEACRRIRQQSWGQQMLLIAVTGWGQGEDRRKAA
jgi:CheY-like chemotaxis protein